MQFSGERLILSAQYRFMLNASKSFTLIELLVVIAIIGALSAIIAINMNVPKDDAREGAIIQSMNSLRIGGVIWAENRGNYLGFCFNNDCNNGSDDWKKICSTVKSHNGGSVVKCIINSAGTEWCSSSPLPSGGNYCVDSAYKIRAKNCGNNSLCP